MREFVCNRLKIHLENPFFIFSYPHICLLNVVLHVGQQMTMPGTRSEQLIDVARRASAHLSAGRNNSVLYLYDICTFFLKKILYFV